jgi:hypothetical protein
MGVIGIGAKYRIFVSAQSSSAGSIGAGLTHDGFVLVVGRVLVVFVTPMLNV